MKFITLALVAFIVLLVVCSVVSLLGAVLGITLGVVGTALAFAWRVIFSPLMLVVVIVWVVAKVHKSSRRG